MAVIDSILDEELARLLALRMRLAKEFAEFPSGTLVIKRKGRHQYAYRAYRKEGHVITDYIGPETSPQAQQLATALREKRKLSAEIKALAADIVHLQKMINAG
jgi:hypothetical protein